MNNFSFEIMQFITYKSNNVIFNKYKYHIIIFKKNKGT